MTDEQLNELLRLQHAILGKLDNAVTKDDVRQLLAPIQQDIQAHDHFINGNGTVGAKTRLHELETAQVRLRKDLEKEFTALLVRGFLKVGVPLLIALVLWAASVFYSLSKTLSVP